MKLSHNNLLRISSGLNRLLMMFCLTAFVSFPFAVQGSESITCQTRYFDHELVAGRSFVLEIPGGKKLVIVGQVPSFTTFDSLVDSLKLNSGSRESRRSEARPRNQRQNERNRQQNTNRRDSSLTANEAAQLLQNILKENRKVRDWNQSTVAAANHDLRLLNELLPVNQNSTFVEFVALEEDTGPYQVELKERLKTIRRWQVDIKNKISTSRTSHSVDDASLAELYLGVLGGATTYFSQYPNQVDRVPIFGMDNPEVRDAAFSPSHKVRLQRITEQFISDLKKFEQTQTAAERNRPDPEFSKFLAGVAELHHDLFLGKIVRLRDLYSRVSQLRSLGPTTRFHSNLDQFLEAGRSQILALQMYNQAAAENIFSLMNNQPKSGLIFVSFTRLQNFVGQLEASCRSRLLRSSLENSAGRPPEGTPSE